MESMESFEIVPDDFVNFMAWAYVKKVFATDPFKRTVFAHATRLDAEVVNQVLLRFQGYIFKSELRTLGDWNEYVSNCVMSKVIPECC